MESKKVISKLGTLYLEDTNQLAHAAYKNFEHFQRSPGVNMKDFVNKFECLTYNKIRVFDMKLHLYLMGCLHIMYLKVKRRCPVFPHKTHYLFNFFFVLQWIWS